MDGEFSLHSAFCGQASWRIPVVIDAAAAFDATVPGDVPSVVSLHATKALGSGEGGYVASRDAALVTRVKACLAFGFQNGREATVPGFNGKMSEYAACVGLASLDGWDEARAAFELPHAKVRSFGFAFQPTRYIVKQ